METEARAGASESHGAQDPAPSANGAEATAAQPDLSAQLAEAQSRAERYYNDYLYAQAETENVKKRTQRQIDDRLIAAKKALLTKFLPVLDNLQRALSYDDSDAVRGGLQATLKGFEGLLSGERVTLMDVVGKPFDPRIAEAIATRERLNHDDNVVLEEVQRGYMLGDELLRPALVVVSKKPDGNTETDG